METMTQTTRTLTPAAQAAKAIRQELKKAFPATTFRVRSSNFSMGWSVHVDYNDGPRESKVEAIISKYQYGHFDGMRDIYEYSNKRTDIPQAKYVHCTRHLSEAAVAKLKPQVPINVEGYEIDRWVWRLSREVDL